MLVPKKIEPAQALAALEAVGARLSELSDWSEQALEDLLRAIADELGIKTGQLFMSIRVAASGRTVLTTSLETLAALGKEETLRRIERASAALREVTSIQAQ
ncbi:MAG: hypothetical protein KatS3mg057_0974 [Herpetosiphonaceae bacterium]|nr:MAG: hypothetical protein KatS3mg057_0974 [Herpetosiphonaceae bacterium]